jgi:DNA-binding transcriptional ArsR family regulator
MSLNMETRRDVFQAIADPTRRAIINIVAHKSQNLNALAENFDVSRQAISLHIKVLTECGLIVIQQQGRERFCHIRFEKLNEVATWLEQYRHFLDNKMDALDIYLETIQKEKKDETK